MTLMNLESFSEIIKCMNIDNDGCEVEYSTWKDFENGNEILINFNQNFFNGKTKRKITKKELFDLAKSHEKNQDFIISTIYWGFSSSDMEKYRTGNFSKIVTNLPNIELILNKVRNNDVSLIDFDINNNFSTVQGVSYATYSKFLFFLGTKINTNECLILDSKIISKLKTFKELSNIHNITKGNANEMYEKYVSEMNKVAKDLGVEPKKLEAFIFKLKI
jgi:hypothetical protein